MYTNNKNLVGYQAAKVSTDNSSGVKLYQQTQILKQQVPITPIANPKVFQPPRKNVTGFKIRTLGPTPTNIVGIKK